MLEPLAKQAIVVDMDTDSGSAHVNPGDTQWLDDDDRNGLWPCLSPGQHSQRSSSPDFSLASVIDAEQGNREKQTGTNDPWTTISMPGQPNGWNRESRIEVMELPASPVTRVFHTPSPVRCSGVRSTRRCLPMLKAADRRRSKTRAKLD